MDFLDCTLLDMPDRMHSIYSFWFQSGCQRIEAQFIGPLSWIRAGADHSYHHRIRREWARTLIHTPIHSWRALPNHPFIQFLEHQGYDYDEYLIQKPESDVIRIICRATIY